MSVLAMAGALDIDEVAEEIENEGTLEQLREAGCPYGQGFLVARPLPINEIETLMMRERYRDTEAAELT